MSAYKELAARVKMPDSERIARLFQMIADETDAKILLVLPASMPEVAEQLELSSAEAERRIHELYLRGVVFSSRKTTPPKYRMPHDVIHFHDTSVQWKKAPKPFLDLWQEWMQTEFAQMVRRMEALNRGKKPVSRIISANVWINPTSSVLPFDSLKEIFNRARTLAVLPCTCRLKAKKCNHAVENCIALNRSAEYNIERGTGRRINAAEALEICHKGEEAGLVHLGGANRQDDPGPIICNCCPCCCMGLPFMIEGMKLQDPSRFRAYIDGGLCTDCGICVERCYFGAICSEDGAGSGHHVLAEKCLGCGLCQVICPVDAIVMLEARPPDFVPKTGEAIY